ncbi:hypothetical protein B0H13DRAFT_1097845 [Mycena leptocephala]|nr:hypothetical protein B0H13DRAFT_1097845 [Mycena leptocephala]
MGTPRGFASPARWCYAPTSSSRTDRDVELSRTLMPLQLRRSRLLLPSRCAMHSRPPRRCLAVSCRVQLSPASSSVILTVPASLLEKRLWMPRAMPPRCHGGSWAVNPSMHLARSCPKPVDSAQMRFACDASAALRRVWSQQTSGNWRLPYLEATAVRSRRVPWRGRVPLHARSLYTTFTALRRDALFAATRSPCGAAPLRRPEYPCTRDPQAPPRRPHVQTPFSSAFPRVSANASSALRTLLHSITSILSPRPTRRL